MIITLVPKIKDRPLISFLVKIRIKPIIALIRLIPTPVYNSICEGVKNVSGVRSKCEVISQLAPHIERLTPPNPMKKEVRNSLFVLRNKLFFEVFN